MKTKKIATNKIINRISVFICFLALGLTISACSSDDDGDTTKPVIKLNAPTEGAHLLIGDEHGIHLDMDLEDNGLLSSYKINIHPNFDGHGHSRSEQTKTVDFEFTKIWDVSGSKNKHIHHHEIKIPSDATPGNYHLMVFCTDNSGNESFVARNIVLSHDGESGQH